ncbi:MAG: hypothetical protein ACXAC7_07425 [Candidatus Hodarchaeales archaeon]|jgi:hypothetical protein
MSNNTRYISIWSWLIVILYVLLGVLTFIGISSLESAEDLFRDTEFLMKFNFVWFGLIIVIYGIYALFNNYNRMKRLGRQDSLDTQFLIIMTFVFLTIHVLLDFILYNFPDEFDVTQTFAITSTSEVILYGAFVCGLLSIILPKILAWRRSKSV